MLRNILPCLHSRELLVNLEVLSCNMEYFS